VSKSFKVAFIGTGWVGDHQMKFLSKIDGVECVAAADVSEAALGRFKAAWNPRQTFADYKQMLREATDADAISVCTPNGLHAENTIAALQAGKHVLVEKPMAMNAKEAQGMLDAAKASGKQLIIGFQHRFEPKTKLIRDQIASGSFGKILYVRAQALRRRGIPNWGVFGRKDLQGGGPMIDIGVHIMETAHYMIGSPRPVTATGNHWTFMGNQPSNVVSMWPNWDHATYTVEDFAAGMIRFDDGALLTI
jgi:predicted dehydrogenase